MTPSDPGSQYGLGGVAVGEGYNLPYRFEPDEQTVTTAWDLTDEEREAISSGARVVVSIVRPFQKNAFAPMLVQIEGVAP